MTYTVKITVESAKGTRRRTVLSATAEHAAHLRTWARMTAPTGSTVTVKVTAN